MVDNLAFHNLVGTLRNKIMMTLIPTIIKKKENKNKIVNYQRRDITSNMNIKKKPYIRTVIIISRDNWNATVRRPTFGGETNVSAIYACTRVRGAERHQILRCEGFTLNCCPYFPCIL